MVVDKLVDSTQLNTDLTSIANAIRTKGGTSDQLAFPTGFVTAINDIQSESIQRIVLRPDAELLQKWTYDKRIVADEGIAIPAYTTTQQILKSSDRIGTITADSANYRYLITARSLVIPEYNTTNTGRGRFEWSSMIAAHEFIFTPMAELHPLLDGEYTIATNSAAVQGGASYRGLYFATPTSISIYAATSYGIWTSYATPTYTLGEIRINNPSFVMRGQPNIFDQQYWEAITDIRFQYVIELWQVPIDSLQYRGWQAQQLIDRTLNCLYSSD
jgi:hypothetical protein